MKKISLLLFCSASLLICKAQNSTGPFSKVGNAFKKNVVDNVATSATTPIIKNRKKTRDPFLGTTLGTKEWAGKTTYDLQTNGSMQRRVLQYPTGAISCSWTMSSELSATSTSAFADRGTGYAYYNGTTWTAPPTARIEPAVSPGPGVRTGFGTLVVDGVGNENYIAHEAGSNSLVINKKSGTTWATNFLTTALPPQAIWPHTATSGNWMYIVASPSDSNIHTNGIRSGYFFSRSNDNGSTWIDNMIPMPLVDSVGHYRGGGNSYAISARGNTVAILFGDMGTDLTLLKSTDNGANWTKTVIWDFPMNHYNFGGLDPTDINNDGSYDTIQVNDGSFSMVLDPNGVVHAAFPTLNVYKDGSSTGYTYFALTSRLVYYRGAVGASADTLLLVDDIFDSIHDCDKDGTIKFGENYSATAPANDAIYNSVGLITMPTISIVPGPAQKVLIAYSAVMDNDTTIDDFNHPYWYGTSVTQGQPYRDILVVGSQDNGINWTFPVNISKTSHFEEAFASSPEIVTGAKFPVLCQGDIEPGTVLQNLDVYDNEFQNFMILQQVNIIDIFTLGADTLSICNQSEVPLGTKNILNGVGGLVSIYPNPSADVVNVSMKFINITKTATIEMIDITGKIVFSTQLKNVTEESKKISVSSFANGVYGIKITTDEGTITRKFVKE